MPTAPNPSVRLRSTDNGAPPREEKRPQLFSGLTVVSTEMYGVVFTIPVGIETAPSPPIDDRH